MHILYTMHSEIRRIFCLLVFDDMILTLTDITDIYAILLKRQGQIKTI